jgi:serine protease
MRERESRLIEAILGAVLAGVLLVSAFAVVAQELAATDRAIVRLPAIERGGGAPSQLPQVTGRDAIGTDRVIVRLHDWADAAGAEAMPSARARGLSAAARTELTPLRRMSGAAHVMRLTHALPPAEVEAIVARLKADAAVLHAEPDRRKFPLAVPTDPLFPRQWSLHDPRGGIDAPAAWDVTTGSPAIVVAILDTGILAANRDLAGRIAAGFDFIREDAPGLFTTANDGDGRDADPADPGNWLTAAEAGRAPFEACPQPEDSSWHGTHTAGIIAAAANNDYGIAGIAWNVRLLIARVLGKCGGYTSDILDALRWAAGLPVPGVPPSPTPAVVVNLSLGAPGACSVEEQRAIDDALATGRVKAIVTAAGNDAGASVGITPGNCRGVLAVTATDRAGRRAPYASTGTNVALAAPGGAFSANATAGEDGILSLFNGGRTTPAADSFAFAVGTSEAAAHVSGVAALALSVQPTLTADALRTLLRRTARAFPDASCTTAACGAGIVDAGAAVRAATAAPAPATTPAPAPGPAAAESASTAAAVTPSGGDAGSGGGGGCTLAPDAPPDVALVLLVLWAIGRLLLRRSRRHDPRRTARA